MKIAQMVQHASQVGQSVFQFLPLGNLLLTCVKKVINMVNITNRFRYLML